jgi:hypothetical protein
MTEEKQPPARPGTPVRDDAARRKERLAAALRDNLRKRKDQSRARPPSPRHDEDDKGA